MDKKNKGGRPKKEIDWEKLETICQYKVSLEDSAALMDCKKSNLENKIREKYDLTFREYRDQRMSVTRLNLFSKQLDVALKGNVAMLIFLGKNMLNQTDKQETSVKNVADAMNSVLESLGEIDDEENSDNGVKGIHREMDS